MKRLFVVQVLCALLLLLAVAVYAGRLLNQHSRLAVDLGGHGAGSLKPATEKYLAALEGRVSITYFVSARESMPSSMKGVERRVRALLEAMRSHAPDHLDVRVLDPDAGTPEAGTEPAEDVAVGHRYAAGTGVSPLKLRRVLEDESSEETVWSALALSHDRHRDALIPAIRAADLPHLEDLIVEHLKGMARAHPPVIAVAAPGEGFELVVDLANAENATVIRCDPDLRGGIPRSADLLFWIEPPGVAPEVLVELEAFLRSGRTLILGGSALEIRYDRGPRDLVTYLVEPPKCDWNRLLRPLGLRMIPPLILDKNHDAIPVAVSREESSVLVDAPFHLRVVPSQYDTRGLRGPAVGTLLLSVTSAIAVDAKLLARARSTAKIVATTSEFTRVLDPPEGPFSNQDLAAGESVAKQPWLVWVQPDDPWRGDALVVGSSGLFRTDIHDQGRNANRVFLRTLLRTFTEPGRLARNRVARPQPAKIPSLSIAARVAWRGVVVFFLPMVMLGWAVRLALRNPQRSAKGRAWVFRLGGSALLGVLLMLASHYGARWLPVFDVTGDRANSSSPQTRALLEDFRDALSAELVISDPLAMPSALKGVERRIRSELRALGISHRTIRPGELSEESRRGLEREGIRAFDFRGVRDDAETAVSVWSAVRLRHRDRSAILPRIDPRTVESLEFLIAAAVTSWKTGHRPHVAVLSDLPRLSPAEAYTDYQKKGYIAPVGSDVYSRVKSLLADHGYRVTPINPKAIAFPDDMDLLLWLQPRNPASAIPPLSRFLADGGAAIVALQHYNIQQRQYRGAGFETVYWPQPQFHRFNEYLERCGIRQVGEKTGDGPGEILFDRNHGDLVLDTQVQRSAFREYQPQQVARPFLIRALGEGLGKDSVITRRLGQLLFVWGNRFRVDSAIEAGQGLRHEVIVSTSARAWTYEWTGGWIPEESFLEPQESDRFLGGRQPLALLARGTFPRVELEKNEQGREVPVPSGAPTTREGALLLVGSSEMFKDPHLYRPGYQHDQFLLNAVADLVHGQGLAEIQARRRAIPSFAHQEPETKLALRALAIGAAPLLFLLYGASVFGRRRRPHPLLER